MRKIIYLSSLSLGLSLLSSFAYADYSTQDGMIVNINGGYSGLLAPRAPTNYGTGNTNLGTYKVTGTNWSASAGYQWALDNFSSIGYEIGYSKDGHAKYTGSGVANDTGSLTLDDSSIDLLATFNTFWNTGINVFVKGGLAWQSQKAILNGPLNINGVIRPSATSIERDFAPVVELGIGYMITNNLDIYTSVSGILAKNANNWAFSYDSSDYNDPFASYRFRLGLSYIF